MLYFYITCILSFVTFYQLEFVDDLCALLLKQMGTMCIIAWRES